MEEFAESSKMKYSSQLKAGSMKKKRSQSENRNRNMEPKMSKEECDYFANKLKSTIKCSGANEQSLFFSKRKTNQHSVTSKKLTFNDSSLKDGKCNSEKKPQSGLNLLRANDPASNQVPVFNLTDNYCTNLRQSKLERT